MRSIKMNNSKLEYSKSEVRTVMKGLSEWEKLSSGGSAFFARLPLYFRRTAFIAVLAIVCALCLVLATNAGADTAGPNNPSSGSNNSSIGNTSWSNTSNIRYSDNSYARASLSGGRTSNYLVATDFGFLIPSDATITGIRVDIEKADGDRSSSADIRDYSVKIVKNNLITGSDYANTSTDWSTSDQWTSYGSNSDLWGTTWTTADINSGNFGAALSVRNTSSSRSEYAYVDNMRITVYYSSAPACNANAPTVSIIPSSQTITTNGGSAVYSMTIKNNDIGSVCSNVTYSLSALDSNTTNFNASTLGSNSVTLSAGATSSAIALTVSGKAGNTSGTDTTTVTASASGHTNGSGSASTNLNVYVPPVFDSSGPNKPSIGSNNSSIGQVSWSYTSYVKASDNSDARVYLDDHDDHHNHISNYLVATGFGFSIPSNATITGIKLDIEKAEGNKSSSAYIRDYSLKIVKNGSITGSEHANINSNWSGSDQWTSYGSNSDLWGTNWTPSDINSGNFGAAISAKNTSSSNGEYANVDNMRITVYFSVPSPCTETEPTVSITPSSQTITTNAGTAVYSITITNNDAVGCLNATYSLSTSDSNTTNFNASTLGSSSVTLAPGATSSAITLTASSKAGQTTGTDTTTVTASASGHPNGSNSVITTLDVPGCIAMAPTVSITPYSRTITANGGSGAYSMTIRNNDAGIGCPNVMYSFSASDSNTTNFNASTLGSSSVTLAQGATSSAITLTATGKAGHTSGINLTTVTASASGHENGISNVVTTTLNISATNTYSTTTCNDCHKTVPVDATVQRGTPPTAVIGSHSVHAAIHGNACTTCHIDANNLGHRNGWINMSNPINGGSYSKGISFPQVNDMTGAGLGTCSSTYCHGSAGTTPKWGTNTSKIGTCDLCHGMVGTYPSRDTEGQTAVTDPQVGAHNAHLNATHNLSSKIDCSECHTVPNDLDVSGHYDTARPAEVPLDGTIANSRGAMPSYTAGQCLNTWCHDTRWPEGNNIPTWNVPLLTGDKNNDCAQCHGFPPSQSGVHAGLDVNKAGECAGCHDHVNADNDGFIDPSKHVNGKVEGGSCLGCHSTPKGNRGAVVGQFSANSHHVQGVTLTDAHCYQCHWEATSEGSINSTYHGGSADPGAAVDLVIYGNGIRPTAYTIGTTAVEYTAGATGGSSVPIVNSEVKVVDTWRQLSTSGSSASRTASFTAGSGDNRMVIIGMAWEDSASSGCNPNTITGNYGGQAINTINEANTSDNKEGQWMGYIGETGIAGRLNNTITLTFSGCTPDRTPTISAATYEGVDQTSVPVSVIADGRSGSSFTWSGLQVVKNGYAMYNLNADGISSFTPPSGYTERYDSATSDFRMTGGDKAITTDGTESRTVNGNTSSSRWALVAVSVKPASGSAGGALRPELLKINQHCLGCHSTQNNSVQPFGDGKTPKQYSWDGTSVGDRYSQTGTTTWGKYTSTTNAAKKNIVKAYSAHGNAGANARGWNTTTGVDGSITNTSGAAQVLCFDCHNSHGSTVTGITTSYTSANTNGGILKDTTTNMGGYTMTYKPAAGGSATDHNIYNPGAALCFDCHLTANGDTTKPWGYQGTFSASQAIMGYFDTQYFGQGTFGYQQRYDYKASMTMKGGHFGASLSPATPVMGTINGLCTPCHDPHGVSASLGSNQAYGVPLLKGTWMTSPYKEDAAPIATNEKRGGGEDRDYVFSDASTPSYNIDQNTFDTATTNSNGGFTWNFNSTKRVTEAVDKFGGLCLKCHPKTSINATTSGAWKSTNRVHNTVKGWGGSGANANNSVHSYTCSKCHVPHNSALNRLMVTNCLDYTHRGRVVSGGKVPPQHSYRGDEGQGAGRFPGGGGGRGEEGRNSGPFFFGTSSSPYTRACHDNANSDSYPANQRWNAKTLW